MATMKQFLEKAKRGGRKVGSHVKKQAKFYGGAVLGAAAAVGVMHVSKK